MSRQFSLIKYISIGIGCIVLGYILYGTHTLWGGPRLVYLEPPSWKTIDADTVVLEGRAKRAEIITVNDYHITQDLQGYFIEEFAIFPGDNVFTITMQDRFGKKRTRIIHIIGTKEQHTAPSNSVVE